jgi:hypothetical protein
VREIRTHGSTGRGSETDSRQRLHGHKAGNGGHSQVRAYGAPRRSSTLRLFSDSIDEADSLDDLCD